MENYNKIFVNSSIIFTITRTLKAPAQKINTLMLPRQNKLQYQQNI